MINRETIHENVEISDDDDDVYLDKLQTRGDKNSILYI
jgi:urease accessory protein UreH